MAPRRRDIAHLVIDSTGLKVFGEGELKFKKHGATKRRKWCKLHLAIDAATHEIVFTDLSLNNVTDAQALPRLMSQTDRQIKEAWADGAYDVRDCHDTLNKKEIKPVIPPRSGAEYWLPSKCSERNQSVEHQLLTGNNEAWKDKVDYHRRSLAETPISRIKKGVLIKSALLVLKDGTKFHGQSIGAAGTAVGEVVFNTSITGYQEILTDPSYSRQIVTLTYPHIGNTGTNEADNESARVQAQALVIRDLPLIASNFRDTLSLSDYLKQHHIVGIADIDTRKLTRLLRETGAQNGCIIAGDTQDVQLALRKARDFPGLNGMDLAKEVSTSKQYSWTQGSWTLNGGLPAPATDLPYHVVAYDYGIKRNIMRMLVDRGCRLTVVPAQTPAEAVPAMNPDGIFLANGPGDPATCVYAIAAIKTFLTTDIPLFGICLGHQLLALASGAKTVKMKLGHHGGNHPVKDLAADRVMITAQNHGFAVDANTLPETLRVTHISLFDGTLQGLHRIDKPAFSFQGHPEGSPGPHDAAPLFNHFIELIKAYRSQSNVSGV